jgi:hypothetical protein
MRPEPMGIKRRYSEPRNFRPINYFGATIAVSDQIAMTKLEAAYNAIT